uniref:Uncharacterized protein n=1 Tax=Magnetococcus massalia (strain MO-1) TaxID=451514 RepID=A0A1S7LKW7_MAGMO|nr:protein of unknown function [Candidatus Magnetococcus massalia]
MGGHPLLTHGDPVENIEQMVADAQC